MRRGWLWLVAAIVAGVYAAAVAWSGGFDLRVAGVHVRSHAWERPAIAAAAAFALFILLEGRAARAALRIAWPILESGELARALICVAIAWTIFAGARFSTFAAGGSDSYGYLSQAYELKAGHVSSDLARDPAFTWTHADATLVPLGYTRAPTPGRIVPTYPPGLSLLMAAALPFGSRAAYLLVPLFGACLVYLTYRAGALLGDSLAGAVAALLLSVSPIFLLQLIQPMSDVPAAACWAMAMVSASRRGLRGPLPAGIAAGVAIMIRPNLAPLALIAMGVVVAPREARIRRLAAFIAPFFIAAGALASIQAARYGSPLGSGYGAVDELFARSNVSENLRLYASWVTRAETPVVWLCFAAPLLSRRLRAQPLFIALALLIAGTWCAYLPYGVFHFDEWTYTRFLLPAIPFMLLFATLVICAGVRRLPIDTRAPVLTIVVVLVAVSLGRSAAPDVRGTRAQEQRYPQAGHFVRDALPANAIVLAGQHSGSVRLYSGRLTIRWDLADPGELDTIVEALRQGGFVPVAVLDAGEVDAFRAYFHGQRHVDRLRPLAEFGQARVYSVD